MDLALRVEDHRNVRDELTFELSLHDVVLRVFLKIELTTLPDARVKGGTKTSVNI